jgi:hypothetical protein
MDVTGRSNVQKHRDGISMFSCVSIVDWYVIEPVSY